MLLVWKRLYYGEGGIQNGRRGGGACEVLPLRKGRAEKVSAMLKGGHNKFWGHFYIGGGGGGGTKQFYMGTKHFYMRGGGATKSFGPAIF